MLSQVERFFALLTEKQIKRGVHRSVADLRSANQNFLDQHNAEPKPFRWTKSADDILASIERLCTYNSPAELCPNLGDDGLRGAAYRGGWKPA